MSNHFKATAVMRRLAASLLCLVITGAAGVFAQETRTVTGHVSDGSGEPLLGATVLISGTLNGTVTDIDGNYSLPGVADSDVLEFQMLGYGTVKVPVGGKKTIDAVLEEDTTYLDEVVVVGYGSVSRKHIISSVSQIKSDAIADRPVANIQQALQGAAANLIIQNRSYDPTGGGQMNLSIRGVSTMGNNSPLVVIDSVPQASADRMNDLNPNDIESISILKDAGSSAIYGARSSNGVILITTKGGKREQAPTVKFSAQLGAQNPHILFRPIPSYKNSILRNEALANSGRDPIFTTDEIRDMYERGDCEPFVNQAMKNALQQNYNISVSGGTARTTYMISAGFLGQGSNYIGPKYGTERWNVMAKVNTSIGRFKVGGTLGYTKADMLQPTTSGFLFADLARFPTYWFYRTMDDDGYFYANNYKYGSPAASLGGLVAGGTNKYDNDYFNGTLTAEFEIIKGLSLKGVLSGESRHSHRFTAHKAYNVVTDSGATWGTHEDAVLTGATNSPADDWTDKSTFLTGQVLLDFNRDFGKHSVAALVGWSQESNIDYSTSIAKTYLNDLLQPGEDTVVSTGSTLSSQTTTRSALMSVFGRASYSYADRYYLELTARYDMSSKFLKKHNGGFFPAVSVGWRLSDEKFMTKYREKAGDLKLRLSYGLNGNQQDVGLYDFMTTYGTWLNAYGFNGTPVPGLMFTMGNDTLTWETAQTFNAGVDATFFKNSLSVSFDYFYKRTKDILLTPIVTDMFGASIAKENRGVMDNQGWELTINYNLRHGDWEHNFNFNLADSRNKVVKYGDPAIHENDGVTVLIQEGLPLNSYYGWKVQNYFTSYDEIQDAAIPTTIDRDQLRPGDVRYTDINGDGVIDNDDRTYLGYGFPRYTFGFGYSVRWKGIDFSILLQGVLKRTNAIRGELFEPFHADYGMTMYEHQMDYWTPDNTGAWLPRLATAGSVSQTNNYGQAGSSINMLDGAYLRVKNIQLGYTLPSKWTEKIRSKGIRIFFDAQNPLTFTKYKFVDPETTEFGSNMSRGGANSVRNYPMLRYFGGGVNVTF